MVEIRQLGGALAREPRTPSAVAHRTGAFQLFAATVGAPGMSQEFRPALEAIIGALKPWATGHTQINFLTGYDVTAGDVEKAYPPVTFEWLRRIKTAYDPRNLFRINHNIPPLS